MIAEKELTTEHYRKLVEVLGSKNLKDKVESPFDFIHFANNRNAFFNWLNLPNTALGGLQPQELIEIPGGGSKVKDILGRIEYGVYS